MLAVEINAIGVEALETRFARLLDVLRAAIDLKFAIHHLGPELGREKYLVPPSGLFEPAADELLVGERAVSVAGDPKVDSYISSLGKNSE